MKTYNIMLYGGELISINADYFCTLDDIFYEFNIKHNDEEVQVALIRIRNIKYIKIEDIKKGENNESA